MTPRRLILLCLLVGLLVVGWFRWGRSSHPQSGNASAAIITKQPVNFVNRTFDPAHLWPEMPPLSGAEGAECESNFLANATVGGETRATDDTRATVTITQIKMTLQLNITIWVPSDASQRVLDHEQGHRQISEYYYETADKLAQRIAERYIGRQLVISGADLNAASSELLQQMGADIIDEYKKELNPERAQLQYDAITDHSRNDVVAKDAVAQVLKDVSLASTQP